MTTLIPSPTPALGPRPWGGGGHGNVVIFEDRIPLLTSLRSGERARFVCFLRFQQPPLQGLLSGRGGC